MPNQPFNRVGLFMSGGGARGAYQAGVLRALTEISLEINQPRPFEIITGVSSGAINASYWAAHAHDIKNAAIKLTQLWENITPDQVFQTGFFTMLGVGLKWLQELSFGSLHKSGKVRSLLKTEPLKNLIQSHSHFENIQKNIDAGHFRTLAITSIQYATSKSITFVQGSSGVQMWRRMNRESRMAELTSDHVMASTAIPIFFPTIKVDGRFYGDGSLRNMAPLSPAINLGAEKLIIVGVKRKKEEDPDLQKVHARASVARIAGVILNSILLDAIDQDIENLCKINRTLKFVPKEERAQSSLKLLDFIYISPSEDIGQLAMKEAWRLPRMLRYMLGGLGSLQEGSELISYLMFEPNFCRHLCALGYEDCMKRKEDLKAFLVSA